MPRPAQPENSRPTATETAARASAPGLDAEAEAAAAAAKVSAPTAPAPAAELPGVPPGAVPAAPQGVRARPAPAPAGSLDALSLAKGIAAEQLSSPGKVLALVAVVVCVSLLGGPVFRVPADPGDRKAEDRPCVMSWQP